MVSQKSGTPRSPRVRDSLGLLTLQLIGAPRAACSAADPVSLAPDAEASDGTRSHPPSRIGAGRARSPRHPPHCLGSLVASNLRSHLSGVGHGRDRLYGSAVSRTAEPAHDGNSANSQILGAERKSYTSVAMHPNVRQPGAQRTQPDKRTTHTNFGKLPHQPTRQTVAEHFSCNTIKN